jgi:hypothetical protein
MSAANELNAIGYLPMVAVLASLTNFENDKGSVKWVEVADTGDDYFENIGLHNSPEEILRALIDVDDAGDFAIRYSRTTATGSTKYPTSEVNDIQVVRSWIGKAADGRPHLRMVFQTL